MDRKQNFGSLFPCMTAGVMGSAGGQLTRTELRSVHRLGAAIAKCGYGLITGACPSMPHEAVRGAKEQGSIVVGISPALNLEEHVRKYHSPTRGYDAIIDTGSGLMGREIKNIRSCDVVIFAGGRSGMLGEFAIAYDEGKVIGILEGTGGITQHLKIIISMVQKNTGAIVCYDSNTERLLQKLEYVYKEHVLPRHLTATEGYNPDGTTES